jgi:hypothetical protein
MKRVLLAPLAVIVFCAFSCKWRAAADPTSQLAQKTVTITINNDSSGRCVISDPVPDPVRLRKNQDKIKWCIVYDCRLSAVRVVIDDFHDNALNRVNPFGNHSAADNAFGFGPLNPGGRDCDKTSKAGTTTGTYKYRITLIGPDGSMIAQKDPGAVIAD